MRVLVYIFLSFIQLMLIMDIHTFGENIMALNPDQRLGPTMLEGSFLLASQAQQDHLVEGKSESKEPILAEKVAAVLLRNDTQIVVED